jgi:hypothetical protein
LIIIKNDFLFLKEFFHSINAKDVCELFVQIAANQKQSYYNQILINNKIIFALFMMLKIIGYQVKPTVPHRTCDIC